MSSDEDFSLVTDPEPSEDSLEGVKASINKYKKQYDELQQEQTDLADATKDSRDLVNQCNKRIEKLTQDLKDDERSYRDQLADAKEKLDALKQEESDIRMEIQKTLAAIEEEEAQNGNLKEQSEVFSAMPERNFIFKGSTGDSEKWRAFEMKPHIIYPMEGGTALITFEEEEVAKNILTMKKHTVDLGGECSITVEARPVHLMLPRVVEIDSKVCPRRILISNLPKMEIETLVNKLEIHFSKSKHGGGEVEVCEFMPDSGTVILTFVDSNIAKGLTEKEFHEVKLQRNCHTVRVTPFLNGEITTLETKFTMCPRTVLLTGIPNIMDQETFQDELEIHFQKNGNGGGEIEAFLYNPLGQHNEAIFSSGSSDTQE